MPRPVILGIVGDSAAGKTTISGALIDILGDEQVTHIGTDDYHEFDREQRKEHDITPLHPECNYMDIIAQHLSLLREGEPVLKPVYKHGDGTFGPPEYVAPGAFAVVEGLLGYHTEGLRDSYDVRVYLAPPEELRRKWKVKRDTSKRGYTEEGVLEDLEKREPDSAQFIRPQERHADLVIKFMEGEGGDPGKLDAQVVLRDTLPHPDLSPSRRGDPGGDLGEAPLREPPSLRPAWRVHHRGRSQALRLARPRAAPGPLPHGDRQGGGRDGRRRRPLGGHGRPGIFTGQCIRGVGLGG